MSLCLLDRPRNIFIFSISFQLFFLASTFVSSCSPDGRSLPMRHGSNILILIFLDPLHNIYPYPQCFLSSCSVLWLPWHGCLEILFHFTGLNQSHSHLLSPRSNFHTPTNQEIQEIHSMILAFFVFNVDILLRVFNVPKVPTGSWPTIPHLPV